MKNHGLSEVQVHLLVKGQEEGDIKPFGEDFYARFAERYADCLPIEMDIKYCLPKTSPRWCETRSLRMFVALDDQNVSRCTGNWLDDDYHFWLEEGDLVYCPTYLATFPREMFYEIFRVRRIKRKTYGQFAEEYPDLQYRFSWFTLEDYLPGGGWRSYLDVLLPWYEYDAVEHGREDFLKDLMEWEKKVKYRREVVFKEVDDVIPAQKWR